MTSAQAKQLKPGDRVHFSYHTTLHGTIQNTSGPALDILWDDGSRLFLSFSYVKHLILDPQGTSK
jgi:hypothetical protein